MDLAVGAPLCSTKSGDFSLTDLVSVLKFPVSNRVEA